MGACCQCPDHAAPPPCIEQHARKPASELGMEETKGVEWRVFGWACYEDTFGFSEDNEHSFASAATAQASQS